MSVDTAKGYKCFEVSTSDGVAHVKMNRPAQANSMIGEFCIELPNIVRALDESGKTRALILSGEGKHFCSGMDLAVFQTELTLTSSASEREVFRRLVLDLQQALTSLETSRMPVIAAVQGACIGGAVDMICACDMRYCTSDAYFQIQEINLGIMADMGTLQRLQKLIPSGIARELAYTGERLSAHRAYEIGLVNRVFSDQEQMMEAVNFIAKTIAEKSPLAVAASKQSLNYARDHSVADSLEMAATLQASIFDRDELLRCIQAAKEKRVPAFDDLKPVRKP